MMNLIVKSLWNRKGTALLTIFSIAISVALLIGVEQIRKGIRTSFASAVSGTDLIVGARGGSLQLLLYSVFRIGNAPNNLTCESYQDFHNDSRVLWTIPFSLGDSHHGYRVLGTNLEYFKRFRYGNRQHLQFTEGKPFSRVFETVHGAEVARKLGYRLDDQIKVVYKASSKKIQVHPIVFISTMFVRFNLKYIRLTLFPGRSCRSYNLLGGKRRREDSARSPPHHHLVKTRSFSGLVTNPLIFVRFSNSSLCLICLILILVFVVPPPPELFSVFRFLDLFDLCFLHVLNIFCSFFHVFLFEFVFDAA